MPLPFADGAPRNSRRGQPLQALGAIVVGWIALRALFLSPGASLTAPALRTDGEAPKIADRSGLAAEAGSQEPLVRLPGPNTGNSRSVLTKPILQHAKITDVAARTFAFSRTRTATAEAQAAATDPLQLHAKGLSSSTIPLAQGQPAARSQHDRFSGDAWLALRGNGISAIVNGAGAPSYGASQAGAIIHFSLGRSARRPAAYARVVQAIGGPLDQPKDGHVGLGLSARPAKAVPLTLYAELRLSQTGSRTAIQPAVFLASGGSQSVVAVDGVVRGYAQAGYVGGPNATYFADGSAVAERIAFRHPKTQIRLGAGAWGGAQEGVGRVDVGPSGSATFAVGKVTAQVEAQYRFRVAGNAEPSGQPAVTVSVSF